jgi:hypothetical protein
MPAVRRPSPRPLSWLPTIYAGDHAEPEVITQGVRIAAVHPPPPLHGDAGIWRGALRAVPSASGAQVRLVARDFDATFDHRELRRVRVDGVHVETVPGADHRALIAQLTLPAGQ